MTTDPKALIEQLEQEAACNDYAGLPKAAAFYRNCAQALRDLTAENERLQGELDVCNQCFEINLKALKDQGKVLADNARLKALGDGLAEALKLAANRLHRCSVDYGTGTRQFFEVGEWTAEARAALAAWEANHVN